MGLPPGGDFDSWGESNTANAFGGARLQSRRSWQSTSGGRFATVIEREYQNHEGHQYLQVTEDSGIIRSMFAVLYPLPNVADGIPFQPHQVGNGRGQPEIFAEPHA